MFYTEQSDCIFYDLDTFHNISNPSIYTTSLKATFLTIYLHTFYKTDVRNLAHKCLTENILVK